MEEPKSRRIKRRVKNPKTLVNSAKKNFKSRYWKSKVIVLVIFLFVVLVMLFFMLSMPMPKLSNSKVNKPVPKTTPEPES